MTPIAAPSPNFDARIRPPDMIVLHYTGMRTGEAALARLRDPEARVSAHYAANATSTPARSGSRSSIPATNSATGRFLTSRSRR
jgi:N-acetyl-anhydromuramyl-L-alanine amidase AmpD